MKALCFQDETQIAISKLLGKWVANILFLPDSYEVESNLMIRDGENVEMSKVASVFQLFVRTIAGKSSSV